MKFNLLIAASLIPLLLGSCKSYNDRVQGLLADYETGNFDAAADLMVAGEFDEALQSDTDGLLFLLEAGKIMQDAGRYAESSAMFDRAYARMEKFDLQAKTSISNEFFAAAGTQSSLPYRGTDYDRILLDVYETLNYLAVDDFGEAMVHVRRAYRRQKEAVANNQDEIAARKESANSTGDAAIESEAYKEFEASFETLSTDAYSDFVNPMATFLSAVLLREEDSNDNALVDLRKLLGMQPEDSNLVPLLAEFEADSRPVENRFYVIFENGMAPRRDEWSLTLPTPNGLSRVAVPTVKVQPTSVRHLQVEALDGSFDLNTERVASIDSIVVTDFKNHLATLVWRTVIAQVLKEGTTYALAEQDSSGLALFAGSLFKVLTAGADLRTWRTPGSEFQVTYGQVPEDGQLSLQLIANSGAMGINTTIVVPPARTTFIYVRTPRQATLVPHIFSLGSRVSN